MMNQYDAVILGAGPAGSVAAYVPAKSGKRVALIDRGLKESLRIGESLTSAALPLLRDIGLEDLLAPVLHFPSFGTSSAWGESTLAMSDSLRSPRGHGWHLDRARFDRDLLDAAIAAGVKFLTETHEEFDWQGSSWLIATSKGPLLSAWLIDATGRASRVSLRLGATRDYGSKLFSVYAWADSSADHDSRSLIESVEGGWSPITASECEVVGQVSLRACVANRIFNSILSNMGTANYPTDAWGLPNTLKVLRDLQLVSAAAAQGMASNDDLTTYLVKTHDADQNQKARALEAYACMSFIKDQVKNRGLLSLGADPQ